MMPEPDAPAEHRRSSRQLRPRLVDNALTGNEVFELLDDYIIDDSPRGSQPKRRKKAPATKPPPKPRGPERPRWYNQMYLMFLALRQSPGHTASRSDLVRMAVELDDKISRERGLPRAFRGKTPMNSASALLTNNEDRHFVQFRPPGAKCYHFRLAYTPGDFDSALAAYNQWMHVLVTKDWPLCFGAPEPEPVGAALRNSEGDCAVPVDPPPAGDAGTAGSGAENPAIAAADKPAGSGAADPAISRLAHIEGLAGDLSVSEEHLAPGAETHAHPLPDISGDRQSALQPCETMSFDIPTSWRDLVAVRPSTIPNAGNGLFAVRDLPGRIPLGFYFGVPMTEDEFDSLKEKTGMASHYSIMYRKTVLDATDAQGMPYVDPEGPLYCPFHFMNEARTGDRAKCNIAFLEGVQVNQIICLTVRKIRAGEELFVSYGDEVDRSHWDGDAEAARSLAVDAAEAGGGSGSPRMRVMRAAIADDGFGQNAEHCVAAQAVASGLQTMCASVTDNPADNTC
ncbi:hypothetical protein IWW54_000507 [Coemansia sp. RSA 2705]|nr:hypothetical protein IWW54_000507 [Coemansia sp. RSA 2705]